jgi:hypothetical protein
MESVLNARELQQEYEKNGGKGFSPEALYAIGVGIHTVTDSTSPAHAGYQVWHGLDSALDLIRGASHAARESEITPEQRREAINKGRAVFQMAFGSKLSAIAFKPKK